MERKPVNRRAFLKGAAMAAGAALIAARTPASTAKAAPAQPVAPILPRKETLYYSGYQWGSISGWNPYTNQNNNWTLDNNASARVLIFETPYIYNMLDGQQYPLLADGAYTWNAQKTQITFKIKAAAKWSDGTPVTAEDVAYTFASHVNYQTFVGQAATQFIQSIVALDAQTVLVNARLDGAGKAINPLLVMEYLSSNYVIQKAWTQTLEARANGDANLFREDLANDFIASGPYGKLFVDDQIVILARNENYWGKDASMWGKLPAPKYVVHKIFVSTDESRAALKAGEVDVSQEYVDNVQDLWLKDKLPISTYLPSAPYNICASLPSCFFNLRSPGLDQAVVRKAIAIATNYNAIIANAMTNQSPTFIQVPRSVMNPTPGEQALYEHNTVKNLQWAGGDIAGAKKLLDDAGITDINGDGWRDYQGLKLSYTAACPNGWTDWQAAIYYVAQAAQAIGIEVTPVYPEPSEYLSIVYDGTQTQYDIFIMWTNGSGPTNPWGRVRQLMSSEFVGTTNNWNGNWGGYSNPAVDTIIAAIPQESDPAVLKQYYTTATQIYLTDVPSFAVMYRPDQFYTVNETVWTNYPKSGDGKNIPPLTLSNGYGIAGLYNIKLTYPYSVFLPTVTKH